MTQTTLFAIALAAAALADSPAVAQQTPTRTAQQHAAAAKLAAAAVQANAAAAPECFAGKVLFYGGDFDPNNANSNGLFNGVTTLADGTVSVPFTVPSTIWNVTGLFANVLSNLAVLDPMTATWSIRKGVTAGNGGTLIASGTEPAAITPTGRSGLGLTEYKVQIANLFPQHLPPGTYWFTVVPQCTRTTDTSCAELFFLTSVEDLTAPNAIGPAEPLDLTYFTSAYFGVSFQAATASGPGLDRFSAGINGTASPGSASDCKNNGWSGLTTFEGQPFWNQGDCIQFVNTGK